jgi:glutamine synthetase
VTVSAPKPDVAAQVGALADAGVQWLIGTFVDNAGITRVKTVPIGRVQAVARYGVGLSPIFAVICIDDQFAPTARMGGPVGDLRLIPDLNRAATVDRARGIAWAPLDQYDQELVRWPLCQRDVLRQQEQRALDLGLSFRAAFEIEFTMLTEDGRAAHAGPGYGLGPLLQLEAFELDLIAGLRTAGVELETLHPEYGPGQVEISLAPGPPVAAVDQYILARLVISRTARQHGYAVSFAPMTFVDEVGNGSHVHFSANRGGQNVFAAGDGPHGITKTGAHLMAGVIDHLGEASGLFAPTIVSYERLQPGHWSGAYACWGLENREAAVRLVRGTAGARSSLANVEVKSIDGASNPYLVLAAIVGLGLSGVRESRQLMEPTDEDPDSLPQQVRDARGVRRMPANLSDALDALDGSAAIRAVLGSDLVDCLVAVRRYELETYGDAPIEKRVDLVRSRY